MRRMNASPDYAALGFTYTVDDAAEVLNLTRAETLDLVRARDLPSLLMSASTPTHPATFLIHADEVRALAYRREHSLLSSDERLRAVTQVRLREYLKAMPPVEDYDEAIEFGYPLWGRTSGGKRTLNVRPDAVQTYLLGQDPLCGATTSAVIMTLERLGAVKVRGVVPWTTQGGKQRWGTMYRIPQSLLDGDSLDLLVRDVTAGQREPGEEVRRRPGSDPYVVGNPW
jgi:hypothetical protein